MSEAPAGIAPTSPPRLDSSAQRPWRRRVLIAAKWIVSITLIWWVLRRVELSDVLAVAAGADVRLLFAAFVLLFLGCFISSSRWRLLLQAQDVAAPRGFLYRAFLIGVFFNNFFPSTVGGDAVRVYDTWRLGASRSAALAIIFVDRFLGVIALTLFALAALPVAGNLTADVPLLRVWIGAGLLVMALIVVMIFAPPARLLAALGSLFRRMPAPARRVQERVSAGFARFRGRRHALQRGLAWSLLLQVNVVFFYYFVARALGLTVPLDDFFLIVPLSLFVMSLPITVNGIGVRESIFVFFFGVLGIASAQAVAFAWVAYALMLIQGMVGGLLYALRDNSRRLDASQAADAPVESPATVRAR